jgi:hypothetical protein
MDETSGVALALRTGVPSYQVEDEENIHLLIWVTQPDTTYPPETAPGAQIVFRMGSIPHGSALLAQGTAKQFQGDPTLKAPDADKSGATSDLIPFARRS